MSQELLCRLIASKLSVKSLVRYFLVASFPDFQELAANVTQLWSGYICASPRYITYIIIIRQSHDYHPSVSPVPPANSMITNHLLRSRDSIGDLVSRSRDSSLETSSVRENDNYIHIDHSREPLRKPHIRVRPRLSV